MKSSKSGADSLLIQGLVVFISLVVILTYFLLTHRRVDAMVSLSSPPVAAHPSPLHEEFSFRLAVAPVISPARAYESYRSLTDRLGREFNLPPEMLTRNSYEEINNLLRNGEVDVAFVCTGGYASAPDAMDVIAAPLIDGAPRYQALIIVPADSDIRTWSDLRGRSFLFTEPDSLSGFWYPAHRIEELGGAYKTFFGKVSWTGTHDHSIRAISQHMADGAAVSSLVYRLVMQSDPGLEGRIRIIERSPYMPSPPVVVRKSMPFSQRNHLVHILTTLNQTQEGRSILHDLAVDGFTPATNQDYSRLETEKEKP